MTPLYPVPSADRGPVGCALLLLTALGMMCATIIAIVWLVTR